MLPPPREFLGADFADDHREEPNSAVETRETVTLHPDHAAALDTDDHFVLSEEVELSPRSSEVDFGRYSLIGELGRGGMGVVYKARQKDLDRVVALKMILSSHLASEDQVARFHAEARAAARLRDPHIVGIHEVGEFRGQHYFTMEYVEGSSLGQILKQGSMPPEEAARLVLTVARAVHYLHKQGLVHRDLKPSNILIDAQGRPYVTDFGLAKVLEGDALLSNSGAILGTPNYMSPEQAAGQAGQVGPRSDIYSLGAILYEAITGRPPHDGDSPLETLVHVVEGECLPPRRINPKLPRPLEQICLKCLEKNPDDRYLTASDLADDLDHFLRGEQVEASRNDLWHHLRRWARREPSLVARLGSMLLCVLIIQANAYLIGGIDTNSRRATAVLTAWAAASVFYQSILRKARWADAGRYGWAASDVLIFTLLVIVIGGFHTSLVAGYFVLLLASGLWFRERLVWLTTLLSMIGYASLAIAGGNNPRAGDSPYHHVIFATALAVSGLIVSYQVKRVRALSQYYQTRPLP